MGRTAQDLETAWEQRYNGAGGNSTTDRNIALGVGLGVGLPGAIVAIEVWPPSSLSSERKTA